MRRAAIVLLACAACGHSAEAEVPIVTPHGQISDEESERLHAACEVRAITTLSRDDIDARARATNATFVEIVYEPEPSHVGVVLFRCPSDLGLPRGS